jgi:hypothetical protein
MGKRSRLFRRQALRNFALRRDLGFWPKVPDNCRRRRKLSSSSLPKGATIRRQAGQRRSRRRPVHGFEPRIVFGTKIATKRNLSQIDPSSGHGILIKEDP